MDERAVPDARRGPWWRQRPGREFLILLLVTDLVFVVGSIAVAVGVLGDDRLSLDVDRGLPETWGYVQLLWAGLALLVLAWRHRQSLYVALGATVAYLLLDDAAQLHETGGRWLRDVGLIDPVAGLEADDAGELVIVAAAAIVLGIANALAYRSASDEVRTIGRGVLGCMLAIAVAGVGIDAVHAMLGMAEVLFVVLEDGGELVGGSVLAAYLVTMTLFDDGPPRPWRRDPATRSPQSATTELDRLPAPTGLSRRG